MIPPGITASPTLSDFQGTIAKVVAEAKMATAHLQHELDATRCSSRLLECSQAMAELFSQLASERLFVVPPPAAQSGEVTSCFSGFAAVSQHDETVGRRRRRSQSAEFLHHQDLDRQLKSRMRSLFRTADTLVLPPRTKGPGHAAAGTTVAIAQSTSSTSSNGSSGGIAGVGGRLCVNTADSSRAVPESRSAHGAMQPTRPPMPSTERGDDRADRHLGVKRSRCA